MHYRLRPMSSLDVDQPGKECAMAGRFKDGKVERDSVVTASLDDLANELAEKDPDFRAETEDTEVRLSFMVRLAGLRRRKRISQNDIARRMGTTQSAISEMEHAVVEARL